MHADIALSPGRRAVPWSAPASNPYTGTPAEAIAAMLWIDERVRAALIEQVLLPITNPKAPPQPRVHITRSRIWADDGTQFVQLRNMNFGAGSIVRAPIDISMWPADRELMATLYRVGGTCLLRVDLCSNWAQVTQLGASVMTVPEPSSLPLVLAAGAAAWLVRRRMARAGAA